MVGLGRWFPGWLPESRGWSEGHCSQADVDLPCC